MKLRETLAGAEAELRSLGVASPRAEAEMLLAAVCGLLDRPPAVLRAAPERELTPAEARTLARLLLERGRGVPVQYLIGRAWFRDLALEVGPGVLIPRPETEVLAGVVIERLRGMASSRVLDLGTGSGCIALAIATEAPGSLVLASDRSREALRWAARNRARVPAEAAARVQLLAADGFSALASAPIFDVIVSNPPYVATREAATLPREVRDHEPHEALFAGGLGLDVLLEIAGQAATFLRSGGLLALEVGESHADNVAARLAERGAYEPARIVRDLAGRERIVTAERLSPPRALHG